MIRILTLTLLFISLSTTIKAIGAYPFPVDVKQPDNTSLKIRIHGDEFYHWTTTTDGYRIVKNSKGVYEYATLDKKGKIIASGFKAKAVNERTPQQKAILQTMPLHIGVTNNDIKASKQASGSTNILKSASNTLSGFPSTGNRKLLVILANFSNTDYTYAPEAFDNMLNQENYNGTGSFRDYHIENSNGQLIIQSTVTQWVTLPNTKEYYAPQSKWPEFAYHAVVAANNAGVNFADFDNDGNGIVDAIAIFHTGRGKEATGSNNDIWSHSHNFVSAGYTTSQRTFDGVRISNYTVQPELNLNTNNLCNIGVICHEFGHSLGLPDYYDTDYDENGSQSGTGLWDLMANGAYNDANARPAHHNPFSKIELGWTSVNHLESPGLVTLFPSNSNSMVYRINTPVNNEYFLLENRIKTGFDSALPGEGMLIYHVDGNKIAAQRATNTINIGEHQGLYIKPAHGGINTSSCPFPGSYNINAFTDVSSPSSLTWNGTPTDKSITNLTLGGNKEIIFDFMAIQNGAPVQFTAKTISHQSIQLNWLPAEQNHPVLLAYNTVNTFGTPENGTNYNTGETIVGGGTIIHLGDNANSLTHTSLQPSTKYYYKLWSIVNNTFSPAINANATTFSTPIAEYPWFENFENGIVNWSQEKVEGTEDWTIQKGGYQSKPINAFEGEKNAFFFSQYKGSKTRLISPYFIAAAGDKLRISFQHTQPVWTGDQDILKVLIKYENETTWVQLANYTSNTPLWQQEYIDIEAVNNFQLAFEATGNYGYGVSLDNIQVMRNNQVAPVVAPSNFEITNTTLSTISIKWSNGSGDKTLVVCREGGQVLGLPYNGLQYNASEVFQSGSILNPLDYVVYNGDGNEVQITNLKKGTFYHFAFFTYNSTDNTYLALPLRASANTMFGELSFNFNIQDEFGNPINNAQIVCQQQTIYTNEDGLATMFLNYNYKNTTIEVSKEGYKKHWQKELADDFKEIVIAMLPDETAQPHIISNIVNQKDVTIEWNPVIMEDFIGYEPYTTTIPNWTFVDLDESETYSLFGDNANYPNKGYTGSFILMNPYYSDDYEIPAYPYSGNQFLGCVAAKFARNNDWIISPDIYVTGNEWLSFMARSYTSQYGLERIKVMISDKGVNITDFVPLTGASYIEVPTDWTLFKYDLSAFIGKKINFAINCVSNDAFLLMIDDIKITNSEPSIPFQPAPIYKIGSLEKNEKSNKYIADGHLKALKQTLSGNINYEVYKNNQLLTTLTGLATNVVNDELTDCSTTTYQVKTVKQSSLVGALSNPVQIVPCHKLTVVVKNGGTLINGAQVTIGAISVMTDENGEAIFNELASGSQLVQVSATGFASTTQSILLDSPQLLAIELEIVTNVQINETTVLIYPNPSKDIFNITLTANKYPVQYKITNLAGEEVYKGQTERASFPIDLKNLPTGVYWLTLTLHNQTNTFKLIKQN
jgi:M6 family metalloprotease-like protein